MRPEELYERVHESPFVPLRVHMSNGRTHEIRHPEMAIIGDDTVALGVPNSVSNFPQIRLVSLARVSGSYQRSRTGKTVGELIVVRKKPADHSET